MKNIHVLPTDKPSRLIKSQDNDFVYLNINAPNWFENNLKTIKQNIYITDDSEIKEGYWYVSIDETIRQSTAVWDTTIYDKCPNKKIILTTDPDLIADGVQAIDDEFLEWFVKNPSCEIEVRKIEDELISPKNPKIRFNALQDPPSFIPIESLNNMILTYKYKIIIPQEEPKQESKSLKIAKSNCLLFADNMFEEIKSNLHKGDWADWKNVSEMLEEHQYHFEKLKNSIESNTLHLIKEHLADCGNILMFIGNQYNLYCNSLSKEEQADILEVGQILVNEETLEYGLLQHIKTYLECNNESQAIRLIEKYGFEMQEQDKNKYSEEDLMESFIDGYKFRAEASNLIFDSASRMYAIHIFNENFKSE
jgi:hypothetical protein